MSEEIYRKLAQRLDALPNGFPATESGVELKMLARIFTLEEATIAAEMRLTREPASDIAARLGMDPKVAYRMLKQMSRKALIHAGRGEGELVFGLMPFVVGFYEELLPRLDAEVAGLFEAYIEESRGGPVVLPGPALHRVIPVEQAISVEVEIYPYERASELLEGAKSWGVRDCICRLQQRLVGKGCDHPLENCLVFAPVEGAFSRSEVTRPISKEEALRILREAEEAGLVHTAGNYRDRNQYICNCCTCSCGILRGVAEFGSLNAVAHSAFRAVVEEEDCIGCADCLERCQFGALSLPADICTVDAIRCVGCGLCIEVCPTGALQLERRPVGEFSPPPADIKSWGEERARRRGIPLDGP